MDALSLGTQLMFCNTYHLMLYPGPSVIETCGGLHSFMNYSGPLITDSGGFQIFSMSNRTGKQKELKGENNKYVDNLVENIKEEGVTFRSYRDGSLHELTPETSIRLQKSFGADIIIPLDELSPYQISPQSLQEKLERTHRWEARSLLEHLKNPRHQAIYSVIHGGNSVDLRQKSYKYLRSLPFDGVAIGGSLGRDHNEMDQLLSSLTTFLTETYDPIHLLGIGDELGISMGVRCGIDTFDSSYPTQVARHGTLLTPNGKISIRKGEFADDLNPIDPDCECLSCKNFSRAYLHHLARAEEPMFSVYASVHNVKYMLNLMEKTRKQILNDEI